MRVLITGATGFIGSHTVRACLNSGMEIVALVLPQEVRAYEKQCCPGLSVVIGSLESVDRNVLANLRLDACIHCAWIAAPGEYLHSPLNESFFHWSRAFFRDLAELGVRRLVGVGSCAEKVLGNGSVGAGATPYVRYKTELRLFLEDLAKSANITCAWARLFYPYGIGEHPERLPSAVCRALLAQRKFFMRCPTARKDYVHVTDVAEAVRLLACDDGHGIFEVGTGEPVEIRLIAETIAELLGRKDLLEYGTQDDALGTMQARPERLTAIGWTPKVTLKAGLLELTQDWKCRPS